MSKRRLEFEAAHIKGTLPEVKTQIRKGGKWYTIADTYCVPGIGSSVESANLIAKLLNAHFAGEHEAALRMLNRLREKVEWVNGLQHRGTTIPAEDWAELYNLTNEAKALA